MLIVKIWGGIGNQLFCYAFYRQLKLDYSEVYADLSWFDKPSRKYYYPYLLGRLGLNVEENNELVTGHDKTDLELIRIAESKKYLRWLKFFYSVKHIGKRGIGCVNVSYSSPFKFYKELLARENTYYVGYWQNRLYFDKAIRQIVEDVNFEMELNKDLKTCLDEMRSCNSVAVHVRRNDYDFESFDEICGRDYYIESMRYIAQRVDKPIFFVFSNKIEKARELIGELPNIHYVAFNDRLDGLKDLYMMTECKHIIISNSTFSWWGAVLNRNNKKIVIMPQKWKSSEQDLNLKMDGWIEI